VGKEEVLTRCAQAVLEGDRGLAADLASEVLRAGIEPLEAVEKGFAVGIRKAGDLWERGEYFLPELALSAEAMKAAMEVLEGALLRGGGGQSKARVVIGTVQGDIHDIGKTLVATMLAANGYEVLDLGADVPLERFVDESLNHRPHLVCMSALLTTTMPGQARVIEMLREKGVRGEVKVVVGGAPTSEDWARRIGADGYAENAVEAVKTADRLIQPA